MANALKIGESIKITFNNNTTTTTKITGRNWWGDRVLSYIVRVDRGDYTVNPETMRVEQGWSPASI